MLALEADRTLEKKLDNNDEAPTNTRNGIGRKPLPQYPHLTPGNHTKSPSNHYPRLQPTVNHQAGGIYDTGYYTMVQPSQWDKPPARAPPVLPPRKLLGPRPMQSGQRFATRSVLEGNLGKENMKLRQWSEQSTSGQVPESRNSPPPLPQKLNIFTDQVTGEVDLRPVLPPRGDTLDGPVLTLRRDTLDELYDQRLNDTKLSQYRHTDKRPSLPPRRETTNEHLDQDRSRANSESPRKANGRHNSPPPRDSPTASDQMRPEDQQPLSITLIRRDPSSGNQWNIGKLTLGSTNIAKRNWRNLSTQFMDSISIDISTPGYAKFTNARGSLSPGELSETSSQDMCFHREIMMRSAGFQYSVGSPRANASRQGIELHPGSEQSTPTTLSPYHAEFPSPEPASPARKYTFLSPWNGSCEFTTGLSGRSLKCKHTRSGSSSPWNVSSTVSELRFNLPSYKVFRSTASPKRPAFANHGRHHSSPSSPSYRKSTDKTDRRDSYDSRNRVKDTPTSSSEEDDEPMDLSLGQERAGGGVRGKRAKLGKIIVQDEGLQMLDLLVAANIGVWWRAYER